MNSKRSYLNLRFLSSTRFASARQTQAILLATLALCVAIFTATPAYGASSKAHSDSTANDQNWKLGTLIPDGQADVSSFHSEVPGFHSDTTLIYHNLHPGVRYELTNLVYYSSKCQEITPGSWSGTQGTYGVVTQGYVYGHLSNGACPGVRFKSRAIYYEWTRDKNAKKDQFKAFYHYAGHTLGPITFIEYLVY